MPRNFKKPKVNVRLDDLQAFCPGCGKPLLILHAIVCTSNEGGRSKIEIETICRHNCQKYFYLNVYLGTKADEKNSDYAQGFKATRKLDKPLLLRKSDIRIIHPKCGFYLEPWKFQLYASNSVGIIGDCPKCQQRDIALLYPSTEPRGLQLKHVWIVCSVCQFDVFLNGLAVDSARIQARGCCGCGEREFYWQARPIYTQTIAV